MIREPDATRPLTIPVMAEVPPALAAWGGRADALAEVEDRFQRRLQRLGVPGRPALRLRAGAPGRAVRVRVHQRLQPFSPELMTRVWHSVTPDRAEVPQRQASLPQAGFPDRWFTSFVEELSTAAAAGGEWELALRFTGELAIEAAFAHPACLLGADQVASLTGDTLREDGPPPDELRQALEELVELGSLPSPATVSDALIQGTHHQTPLRDTIEALAAAGRPDRLELQLSGPELQALVPTAVGERSLLLYEDPVVKGQQEAFKQMERELFAALGVRLPPLFVRRADDLPPGMLRLSVNNLITAPAPCSASSLPGDVKRELRRQAGRLLGIEDVEYLLAQLNQLFPQLVSATLERMPLGELTRILRALLEEEVWIRDLRVILERLLQYDTIPVDASRHRVFDDRLPVPGDLPPPPTPPWGWYLAFVRSGRGLQNHLSHAYRLGGAVARQVRALELPERLEGLVRETAAGGGRSSSHSRWEETQAAVLAVVWEGLAGVPDRDGPVVLLVRDPLTRRAVRDELAGELPTLPVVARAELRPDIEIVPADAAPSADETPAPSPRPHGRLPRLHVRGLPHVPPWRDRQSGDS